MSFSVKLEETNLARKPIRGRVEIFDIDGNKILEKDNLILLSTRLAILYNLFRDQKIIDIARAKKYLPSSTNKNKKDYIPTICGFMFGCNGANISNPSILRVPAPNDNYNNINSLNNNSNSFIPVPMLSVNSVGGDLINTAGSYNNISEFINSPKINDNESIIYDQKDNAINAVKYFSPDDLKGENYYCKAINTSNSNISINPENFEIEYTIKFNIGSYDLIGKSFNEIGLVIANCNILNGIITDIDTSTVALASRLTFDEISLSKSLLSSFNIKYHIYI